MDLCKLCSFVLLCTSVFVETCFLVGFGATFGTFLFSAVLLDSFVSRTDGVLLLLSSDRRTAIDSPCRIKCSFLLLFVIVEAS